MSKKNIKNNKKNSTRKNYKIEALEPRLMMDASADNWLAENALTQSTQMNSFVDNICASSAAGENDVFEGVKKIDGDKLLFDINGKENLLNVDTLVLDQSAAKQIEEALK